MVANHHCSLVSQSLVPYQGLEPLAREMALHTNSLLKQVWKTDCVERLDQWL